MRQKQRTGCIVLAAGAGDRFNGTKQLADLCGRPLLDFALTTARTVAVERRIVVLGANANLILEQVDLSGLEVIHSHSWQDGQSASLRAAVRALSDLEATVILLGDQPFVTAAAANRLLQSRTGRYQAIRSSYEGRPGHPVILERSLYGRIEGLTGDEGARRLLAGVKRLDIPCDDIADPFDIDTESDLIEARTRLRNSERVD